ncbi:NAD(P)/FAD-dependent oxidoreductase [Ureaplasma zalophigenitalium]|uniref:FAD-dependent oxidoreductase n=1 Tax=Ureaplasma zalophigenitalium TaxID=907723 RepID=A0ABT3BPV8_9BACT|nr:FAD-dependent oxidoreductase [Ureaplasma zalophigenitalium]MCV3754261.1 FAD-dependent oxidoreductase [Ureaplasma zalophigenitalium]
MAKIYDCIIIGAGPAGLSAAVYGQRSGLDLLVIEKTMPGGKIISTATIENYLGFDKIDGPDLAYKMYEHAQNINVNFVFDEVLNIRKVDDYVCVKTAEEIYWAKTILIATGTINRQLNVRNEKHFFNKGISFCAICDGPLYKNRKVAVVGSGRSAVDEALYLSTICKQVYLISNKNEFKAEQKNVDLLYQHENIKIFYNHDTLGFDGKEILESITLLDQKSGQKKQLDIAACFIFIGLLPTKIQDSDELLYDPNNNFILVDSNYMSKIPGIFAAGDIIKKSIRQIATAVSDGAQAVLHISEYINQHEWK